MTIVFISDSTDSGYHRRVRVVRQPRRLLRALVAVAASGIGCTADSGASPELLQESTRVSIDSIAIDCGRAADEIVGRVDDMAVGSDQLFFLDGLSGRIAALSEHGMCRWISRRGGGPGELMHPYAVAADSVRLLALDLGRRHVVAMRHNGEFVGRASGSVSESFGVPRLMATPQGVLVREVARRSPTSENRKLRERFRAFAADGSMLAVIDPDVVKPEMCEVALSNRDRLASSFAETFVATPLPDGSALIGCSHDTVAYRFSVGDSTTLALRVAKSMQSVSLPSETRRRLRINAHMRYRLEQPALRLSDIYVPDSGPRWYAVRMIGADRYAWIGLDSVIATTSDPESTLPVARVRLSLHLADSRGVTIAKTILPRGTQRVPWPVVFNGRVWFVNETDAGEQFFIAVHHPGL